MRFTKTDLKLTTPVGNGGHGDPLHSSSHTSSALSPTRQKQPNTKPLHCDYTSHLFDTGFNTGISPTPSFDESTITMTTAASSSCSSCRNEGNTAFFTSVGLPTEYPSHRHCSSLTSISLQEELEDFEICYDGSSHRHSDSPSMQEEENPLKLTGFTTSCRSSSGHSSHSQSRKGKHHRRQKTEIFDEESLRLMVKSSHSRRRRQNHALTSEEFDEQILKQLFIVGGN